ncbi:MAG TPA: DUF4235 domain-containing protein [Mycobacteriales bacterium]|nr:DUF4235 domain-containing protein [Mycobacteriales bacterium]
MEKVLWKFVGIVTGLLAAKTGRSVLDKAWARTRGGEPPRNPAAPGTTWGEALSWAVASGVAVAVARLLATRGAASAWQKGTGHLPPGLEEVGN